MSIALERHPLRLKSHRHMSDQCGVVRIDIQRSESSSSFSSSTPAAHRPVPAVGLRSRPRAGIGRPHCRCPATAYPYLDPKSPAVQAMSAVRSWVGSLVITVNSRPWCTTGSPPANSMIADLASVPVTPAGKATMVGSVDSGQSIVRAGHRVLTWRAGNPVLRGPNSALSAIAPLRPGQDYECRPFEQPTRLQELSCLRQPRFDPPSPRENSAAEPWRSAGKAAAEHHHRP